MTGSHIAEAICVTSVPKTKGRNQVREPREPDVPLCTASNSIVIAATNAIVASRLMTSAVPLVVCASRAPLAISVRCKATTSAAPHPHQPRISLRAKTGRPVCGYCINHFSAPVPNTRTRSRANTSHWPIGK